ncbi:reverse transcriptase domain-containing protein [Embleya sp. NPDC059237]|uniref:reverse transcriptase domain-containing protein n=1 Tax=Embleya sp. NPDC059237 TaxID=3346784 RepID=UPI0036B8B264
MTWAAFRDGMTSRLANLADSLRAGTWEPGPVRHVEISTYTGKQMAAVIPTVTDRVVHRAVRAAVEPVLEQRAFAEWVSGFRPRRNRITALRQAARHLDLGMRWVADIDVERASQGSTTDEVVRWLAAHIHDGTFLNRCRTLLDALPEPLTPGSGLSPLLLNLRLSRVDHALPSMRVVRFADNYCAFAPDRDTAEAAFDTVAQALHRCGLRPNTAKSRVRPDARAEDLFLIAG